ncbi:MAG TPA: enoyl-ACP reductase FabI, partial [Candidatus Sulfotelmatobacter sp.]|nr:enoyl-ACP reductase FabI [Candidatus Sulfotelmatobacter sp.]
MTSPLEGRRILVTGVLSPRSIAFAIASAAQRAGAELVLTSFGRAMGLAEKSAARLSPVPPVLDVDLTDGDRVRGAIEEIHGRWGGLDGAVHSVAFAPADCFGGNFLNAPWESVRTALEVSSYSLATLAREVSPVMPESGGSIVALTFDGSYAWPLYDWMGPAKAALEAIARYLARDLGGRQIRVNCISAGPLETLAAKSIPGFDRLRHQWQEQAPLGWDTTDTTPVADASVFLLSQMSRGITGEVLHVDGG